MFLMLLIFGVVLYYFGTGDAGLWVAMLILYLMHFSTSNEVDALNKKIAELQEQIGKGKLKSKAASAKTVTKSLSASTEPVKTVVADNSEKTLPMPPKKNPVTRKSKGAPVKTEAVIPVRHESSVSFFGQNLIVWIAGFAAILGAFYLIRYFVDNGTLTPVVRFALTVVLGLVLIGIGYILFAKKHVANHMRISQALTGAGLATLYFDAYAVSAVYHFTSEWISFIWMCVVTGMAAILTLSRGGKPIAVMTMIGAFFAPLLTGSDVSHPSFFALYMLLFMGLFCYMSAVMGAAWLFLLALAGVYFWGLFWLFFGTSLFLGCWQVGLMIGVSAMALGLGLRVGGVQEWLLRVVSIIGCFFFAFGYGLKMQFGLMEWMLISLMTVVLSFLTFKDKDNYAFLWVGSVIIGLLLWLFPSGEKSVLAFSLYAVSALGVSYFSQWWRLGADRLPVFGVLCLLFYSVYCEVFGGGHITAVIGLLSSLMLLLPMLRADLADRKIQSAAGIVVLCAAVMAAMSLVELLSANMLPIVAAAGVLLFACGNGRTRLAYTEYGMIAAGGWFVVLSAPIIEKAFIFLGFGSATEVTIMRAYLSLANILCYGALPMMCFAGAWLFLAKDNVMKKFMSDVSVLWGIGTVFAACTALFVSPDEISVSYGFTVQAFITLVLLATYISERNTILGKAFPVLGLWRLALASLALIFGECMPVSLWGALVAYALPTGLFAFYAGRLANKNFWVKAAMMCSFFLVTLFATIWRNGHATDSLLDAPDVDAYSAEWMFLGICWLFVAWKYRNMVKPAFGLIYLVIAKVFLLDVASQSGLVRVVSLFALAGALLGISYVYAKFFKPEAEIE